MEKQEFEVKITVSDLWHIFVSKFFIILLAALLASGGVFAYSSYTYKPVYESTSRIYILPQFSDNEQSASGYSQMLNAALNTVNDCKNIIQSPSTMQRVVTKLDLDYTTTALSSNTTISTSEDSRIITISSRSSSPDQAQLITNTIASEGIERINEVTGVNQANMMDEGRMPTAPINSAFTVKTLLAGTATAILVYAVYVIIFLSNDRIVNPEDAASYLSLTVLGVIPNDEDANTSRKYGNYGYKSKKYGKTYYEANAQASQSSSKPLPKEVK